MPIPYQLPSELVSGIPGEIAFDGPTRATAILLNTATEANNVFGRAFTYDDEGIETAEAGGTGLFAGILIHPKAYAIDGFFMENGRQAELLTMGEVYVQLSTTGGTIGDPIYFENATGALGHGTAGENQTQIPNCVISRHNVSAETPTLAVIKLTN